MEQAACHESIIRTPRTQQYENRDLEPLQRQCLSGSSGADRQFYWLANCQSLHEKVSKNDFTGTNPTNGCPAIPGKSEVQTAKNFLGAA